jgi:uncharacterized protein with PQ loop repeat
MEMGQIQVLAGSAASLILAAGTLNMLVKAWRTKDVHSYSLAHIVLNNVGNLVYWVYVVSLPFGPVWLLHGFRTFTLALMLIWCLMYREAPDVSTIRVKSPKRVIQTMPRVAVDTAEVTRPVAS